MRLLTALLMRVASCFRSCVRSSTKEPAPFSSNRALTRAVDGSIFWMRMVRVTWSGLSVSPSTVGWWPLWCSNQYKEMLRTVSATTRSDTKMSLARLGGRGGSVVDIVGLGIVSVDVDILSPS